MRSQKGFIQIPQIIIVLVLLAGIGTILFWDRTPPVISDIKVTDITSESAEIIWNTDELTKTIFHLGIDDTYNLWQKSFDKREKSHEIKITSLPSGEPLQPGITYYFKIEATDKAGNKTISQDQTFSTLAACSECQHYASGVCVDNCKGTDTSCGCTNCINCNNLDGWVNIGSSYSCCDGNKACVCQKQEYRDHSCFGTSCSSSVTNTRVNKSNCTECGPSESCLNGVCQSNCAGTDTSCGSVSCISCNDSDGCSGNNYLDYYCSGTSCAYTSDDCSGCSCSCGGYNVTESTANGNCSDGKDNDCDGAIDSTDSECTQAPATALITYVIDGDTAKISTGESIRLIGINTPERGQPYYEEATNRLKTLVEGKSVRLEKDIVDQDQWGRLLRFIFYNDENINVKMIREGYATVYIIPPNTKYKAELENAWQECLNDKINLCKPGEDICDNTCIGIDYFHWNAEGNDCYNLNDEYVTFRNSCSYSCDLTDWTVKDESSRSPYSFSTFTLKSGATVILYTGCGTNTETELYWCSSGYSCNAIWNNSCSGDTLYLRNRRGELILDYHYTGFCE